MSQRSLTNQLAELGSIRRAQPDWRDATRARLLSLAATQVPKGLSWGDRAQLIWQHTRLAFSPMPLAPVLAALLLLAVGYTPFASATGKSLPGDALYPVKRAVERVELSFKASSGSQGLYYLVLAEHRLAEAKALLPQSVEAQAKLLRDYNISLGFAQASFQGSAQSGALAYAYDHATNSLGSALGLLMVPAANQPVYGKALELTSKLANQALVLLVGSRGSDDEGIGAIELTARLEEQIAKVEATLGGVDVRLHEFPATRRAPRVVVESREAVLPAAEAALAAKQSLLEAKELMAKKQFTLALEKVQEGEAITLKTVQAVDKVTKEAEAGEAVTPAPDATGTPEVKGDSTSTEVLPETVPATVPTSPTPAGEAPVPTPTPNP